jgi:hypothetical protein
VVDVVVELAPRPHDIGFVGRIEREAEGLENVVGPERKLLPVLAGGTEQRTDDRDGVGPRDVGDDVTSTRIGDPVDQLVDHVVDRLVQACGSPRCERLRHQAAQTLVRGALEAQQAVGDLVP